MTLSRFAGALEASLSQSSAEGSLRTHARVPSGTVPLLSVQQDFHLREQLVILHGFAKIGIHA